MSSEIIIYWLIGSAGVMAGVITFHFWMERIDKKRREKRRMLKRLEEA